MISANYCFQVKKVKLLKSFFNIESKVIKDDKSKLLFSRKKRKEKKTPKKKKKLVLLKKYSNTTQEVYK